MASTANTQNAQLESSEPPKEDITFAAAIDQLNNVQAINEAVSEAKRVISTAIGSAVSELDEHEKRTRQILSHLRQQKAEAIEIRDATRKVRISQEETGVCRWPDSELSETFHKNSRRVLQIEAELHRVMLQEYQCGIVSNCLKLAVQKANLAKDVKPLRNLEPHLEESDNAECAYHSGEIEGSDAEGNDSKESDTEGKTDEREWPTKRRTTATSVHAPGAIQDAIRTRDRLFQQKGALLREV